jgi:hypothetical protein
MLTLVLCSSHDCIPVNFEKEIPLINKDFFFILHLSPVTNRWTLPLNMNHRDLVEKFDKVYCASFTEDSGEFKNNTKKLQPNVNNDSTVSTMTLSKTPQY